MSDDVLADVIGYLEPRLTGCYVSDTAPAETAFDRHLPVVLIRDLPGGGEDIPWQAAAGPLTDVFAFDVDIYATTREQCRDLSRHIRGLLYAMTLDPEVNAKNITEVVGFSRRPDHNPRILRDGAEFELRRPM
ncbi:hypothetical protein L5I01_17495 [Gordonia sp. HY442]|uniref:hypothetical protein n=1 Tax=Gordonia zhenghanii TaxID=2911516 RepID=UPI001F1DC4EA|nr:hypothetical protein [Gordonia zhenghanii]MCF8605152.1 hypothetical protein [Gordonia zhenghanii]